jgi:hypothetical protein
MALSSLSITRDYAADTDFTEAQLDAQNDSIEAWVTAQAVAKTADKTATDTVAGQWTFTLAPILTSNTLQRSDGDVWTLPDAGTQTFVGATATQTLTNKSLTSPTMTGTITVPATDPPPAADALTQGSLVKAWAMVTISGGTPVLTASYNVASVTDNGAGDTEVVWDTDFADANYAVIAMTLDPNGTDPFISTFYNKVAGSVDIRSRLKSTGALTDNISFCVIACGDQ